MERKDIEEKYTWDLSKIYQDPQEFYHDIEVSQQLLDELTSFQGKLTESIETFLRFLSKRDEMSMLVSKAYCFAHLNCDVEPKNQEYQKMLATVMSLIQQSSVKLVFVDNEIVENDETVMIYPTPLKDRTTLMVPYSDLFRNFESSLLKQNSVLITLGYSFADDHINRLILNALAIPTFKLIVFGQSDAIEKLIDLDDKRIIVINSDDKIHYFKNFVDKVMPEQSINTKEMIDMPTVTKIIKAFEEKK